MEAPDIPFFKQEQILGFLHRDLKQVLGKELKNIEDKEGRSPVSWAHGVFLATHPPVDKPETASLIEELIEQGLVLQSTED